MLEQNNKNYCVWLIMSSLLGYPGPKGHLLTDRIRNKEIKIYMWMQVEDYYLNHLNHFS